jgi:hypothetical protein
MKQLLLLGLCTIGASAAMAETCLDPDKITISGTAGGGYAVNIPANSGYQLVKETNLEITNKMLEDTDNFGTYSLETILPLNQEGNSINKKFLITKNIICKYQLSYYAYNHKSEPVGGIMLEKTSSGGQYYTLKGSKNWQYMIGHEKGYHCSWDAKFGISDSNPCQFAIFNDPFIGEDPLTTSL